MSESTGKKDPAAFNLAALFKHINIERLGRDISWSALAREVGVSASTIRRFAVAEDAEADGVLILIRWLAVAPEEFCSNSPSGRAQLLPDGEGVVRVDMRLIEAAQGGQATTRTRTTIQHLTEVAEGSATPIAALVRLSET